MASTRSSLKAASLFLLFSSIHAASTYEGCYKGTVNNERTLNLYNTASNDMTVQMCATFCADAEYFGLEYGRECYCGQTNAASQVAESECSFACSGNISQKCGAGGRLSLYHNDDYVPPSSPAEVGDYIYVDCYVDDLDNRTLPSKVKYDPDLTLEKCAAFCSEYEFFGVEYSSQCYCGNDLTAQVRPEEECRQRCGGNRNQACGDSKRLNIYASKEPRDKPGNPSDVCGYSYKYCYTDHRDARALRADVKRGNDMTVETCAAYCDGYLYFGLENGGECYCGDVLEAGQVAPEKDCSRACEGDSKQLCGAPDRLSIYISDVQ
ncbi:WSC domain-containing protein [Rhypophila decipiens]|uniref:WSC domain-containing protein n=1 Tax=Rhypophila decipiens TaxID=261697 RepID=A0AAN6YBL5_9PEZI|nr:WSC domain-containing protein [Rhypophila decipiens]